MNVLSSVRATMGVRVSTRREDMCVSVHLAGLARIVKLVSYPPFFPIQNTSTVFIFKKQKKILEEEIRCIFDDN